MKRAATVAILASVAACSSSSAPPSAPEADAGEHAVDAFVGLSFPPTLHFDASHDDARAHASAATGSLGTSGGGASSGASSASPSTLTPGTSTLSLTVAGTARTAILYVPTSATGDAPLVIALHGDGDTDTNFLATSGLQPLADQDGVVLVVPQGIPRDVTVDGMTIPDIDWDAYNSVASGNIDLPFLEQLRTQMQATHEVDPSRTFVLGYSQGGYMAFLYGMSDATVLSCAAVLAASSPYGGSSGDPLITGAARKLPVDLQIGTDDPAYSAAQQTWMTLQADGFPVSWGPVSGAGHVPIPGDIAAPLRYCLAQTL